MGVLYMCGFISYFSDEPVLKWSTIENLKRMSDTMYHRGPDQEGHFIDNHIYMGFKRLSIVDPEKGNQPFSYEDGTYHIVFNGEVYNHIELRNLLAEEGMEFKTNSDTEVILALYKLYGKNVVYHLRGMFSFVIWDKKEKLLFGARDHFGIKPFYFMEREGELYCASEKKALSVFIDKYSEIDEEAFHHYFTFQYVPEPKTLLSNISILKPGCILSKKIGEKAEISEYYSIKFNPTASTNFDKVAKIREVLEQSVAVHMRSDVPVGSFLSGGVDSTIIAALARQINPRIKTFTVGFSDKGYSEIDLAKQTAEELMVDNISKIVTVEEFIEELPRIVWHMDSPVADPSSIPLYFIAKEARKHVKVVLSGEGADELFGGYNIYCEPNSLMLFEYLPAALKKVLKNASALLPEGTKGKSFIERGCTPLESRYFGNARIFNEVEKELFLKNYRKEFSPELITRMLFGKTKELGAVTQMQYVDIHTWLRGDILVKADRMTMAHSLEARVPFLDKEVMQIAEQLTNDDKLNNKTTKYSLREAFRGVIPDCAVGRRKLGFPVPTRQWLKDELYDWAARIILESETEYLINKSNVQQMLIRHRQGTVDYSRRLWTILIFMMWHQIFIEKKYSFNHRDLDQIKIPS
jgi:asparagine synthase (glutamine-hydrolysing)